MDLSHFFDGLMQDFIRGLKEPFAESPITFNEAMAEDPDFVIKLCFLAGAILASDATSTLCETFEPSDAYQKITKNIKSAIVELIQMHFGTIE